MKQEALAINLGEDWTQRRISLLEQKEDVDSEVLGQVAKALGVPEEAISNFSHEAAVNVVSSSFHDNASINNNSSLTFNPIEKVVELYERLLLAEKEKVALLEKIINDRK